MTRRTKMTQSYIGNGSQKAGDDAPPTNPEAERALLGSLFALPEAIDLPAVVAIRPGDFFDEGFRVVHRHLIGARLAGQSPETIVVRIKECGEYDKPGVREALINLLRESRTGADASYYAGLVRETAERRKLWELQRELAEQVHAGLPPEEIRGFLLAALEATGNTSSSGRLNFLTSAELADTDQNVPYIVDGVLAEGQPAVVGGPSKAMKTGSLVDLLIAIQCCGHYLGYFRVAKQKRCWLLSGESGQNVIAETAARVAAAAGCDLRSLGMLWGFKLPRLANAADVRELARIVKGEGVGVLGVDPLYLSLDTDGRESSMFGMGPMLRPVAEICVEHGCTPILAHHFRQTIRDFGPPALQDLSHAGIEQFARQWILHKRREAYAAGTGQHRLHLVTGGSAGHGGSYHLDIDEGTRDTPGGRFWQATVTPATQAIANEQEQRAAAADERDRRRREDHRQQILSALRQSPKGETKTGLKEAVKLKTAELTDLMDELITEGKVELCEVKKHTVTHDGYRLTSPQKVLQPVLPGTSRDSRS
jgi:hypothetical protein